ncbi:carboxylating nicotinate-nucleotide diphosphorylase [Sphingobacterium alkalisoli]|uniref:Probable nicotinate-nucleotide pyrophosphorylase [carboxylating] n=1 Tax=Sphingobacterium alkalisoli TaxID=1874115 RepID=A0A4U0GUJ1_9SPHI|nr:carboxylating nicotinate-nucleotide diphosphorylase [Sphingobacterium alkalisoli]TJY62647.1 carboxylating nicotinate-nucleotide diphosphorylase [Sphingobacterium alkalisoli]GGH27980.1 nicotinate-nucleotide diphosphorylase (carboxylating) [Sphingobacterium alkalisoli]
MDQDFKVKLLEFVKLALIEDVGDGDHTSLSTIGKNKGGEAQLLVKEEGLIAGVDVALEIFNYIDSSLQVEIFINDGSPVVYGDIILVVRGNIHSILKAERLVLNVMQRMSGIATRTATYVDLLKETTTKVLDTRKTTPLLRFLEKQAVKIGGGENHRFGLYDMILIKDNHVDYAGGVSNAIAHATSYKKDFAIDIPIEVEVRNFEELAEVLACEGVDRVMFDNFTPVDVQKAVKLVDGRLITEASGGITLETIKDYALAGVDYISVGALTHSVKSLDLSLKAKLI